MNSESDPLEVQTYLGGVEYPAGKDHIIHVAKLAGAGDSTLDALHNLPEKTYQKIADVAAALH